MRGLKLFLAVLFVFLAMAFFLPMLLDVTDPMCGHKLLSFILWLCFAVPAILLTNAAIRAFMPRRMTGGTDG